MIDQVLQHPELLQDPPVLIDIGASGQLHQRWRKIAKYAVCVAFDADERDFGYVENMAAGFKKLYTFNCIVTATEQPTANFYLTQSPHCSSLLRPRPDWVSEHAYADKFVVEKTVSLKTRSLQSVLNELKINAIDWFKVDSQGTDLRLFQSLGAAQNRVMVAEMEPGLAPVYEGEDNLFAIGQYIENTRQFWLAELAPKGSPRITPALLNRFTTQPLLQKFVLFSLKNSAIWAEMTYVNRFADESLQTKRDLLLGWVFATTLKQHGFALILTQRAEERFDDAIFGQMARYSRRQIWNRVWQIGFWPEVVKKINQVLNR